MNYLHGTDFIFFVIFIVFLYIIIKKLKKRQKIIFLSSGQTVELSSTLSVKLINGLLLATIKDLNIELRHLISNQGKFSTDFVDFGVKISSNRGSICIKYKDRSYDILVKTI